MRCQYLRCRELVLVATLVVSVTVGVNVCVVVGHGGGVKLGFVKPEHAA